MAERVPLHTRTYDVQTFLEGTNRMIVVGTVRDTKPPGLYVNDDPDSLDIHEMRVEMAVTLPEMEIVEVDIDFVTHPHETCPNVVAHYRSMVGLNVARGFNRKVRELFGGPTGCTHTTALLQALAPVIVQSTWSASVLDRRRSGLPPGFMREDERGAHIQRSLNTCHVWDEDSDRVQAMLRGEIESAVPIQIGKRLERLGRDPDEWRTGLGDEPS